MLTGTKRALLGAGGERPFDFDPALVTFTRGMRKSPGAVFDTGLLIQGKADATGTPDLVSFPRGAQIASNWYANFDPYQGSIVLFITPEWDGNDGLWHEAGLGQGSLISMEKNASNDLTCYLWDGGAWRGVSTSAAAWTAATTYLIIFRWDLKNTLDGTNYLSVSVADSHTYGAATVSGVPTPDATIAIGSLSSAHAAGALIEGLTIYRRPLWDGAYGIDAGNGDEIALIAAGLDPTRVTGHHDVVFCVPGDSSPGALTTGEGNAWSSPHASAFLDDSFCQTTYGSSGWDDEGTPSTGPADLATAEKIFNGGYKWTCDAANEGVTQGKTCDAGANFYLRVIAHCTSADDIRVRIWDGTNGAQIGADFDFGASSSRTAPGVALICFEAPTIARNGVGSDCRSVLVKVMGTANAQVVYLHEAALYSNLADNPSFETFQGGDPDIPDGWNNLGLDAGDMVASSAGGAVIHSGVDCVQFNTGAIAGEAIYLSNVAGIVGGDFVSIGAWIYGDGAANLDHRLNGGEAIYPQYVAANTLIGSLLASWQFVPVVGRILSASYDPLIVAATGAGGNRYLDDYYAIKLDPVSLTITPASEANSAETSGLRVDGLDACTQPITNLTRKRGRIRWKWTPRHSAANLMTFAQTIDVDIVDLYKDGTNRIVLYSDAANTIKLWSNVAGAGGMTATWDCTGAIVALTTYRMEIRYSSAYIKLLVDGIVRATITRTVDFGANIPDEANWGHRYSDDRQIDATYARP